MARRVLVLSSTTSYRTDDFMRACAKLGVEAVLGTNRCHELAELWPREAFGGSVPIEFRHEAEAADLIVHEAGKAPFDAIVPTDDPTADIAARAAARLGLRGNSGGAATSARHAATLQRAVERETARACAAIGLRHGPVHAELRLSPDGPTVIEVAARSIGGLCARTLRFGLGAASLEELVIANALGRDL